MNFLAVYIPVFLILFLVIPSICFFVRIQNKTLSRIYPDRSRFMCRRNRRVRHTNGEQRASSIIRGTTNNNDDRQGNIFTISDESGTARPYPDFFVLEPSSDDPRLRSQIEKDDKDLPSYEEVMRMCNITAPTAAPAITSGSTHNTHNGNTINDNVSDLPMDVPPYTETDPNPLPAATANTFTIAIPASDNTTATATTTTTTQTLQTPQPSTSRGLSAPTAFAAALPVTNSNV